MENDLRQPNRQGPVEEESKEQSYCPATPLNGKKSRWTSDDDDDADNDDDDDGDGDK